MRLRQQPREHGAKLACTGVQRLLRVDPEQLLAACEHSQLVDRRQLGRAHELAAHTALLERARQSIGSVVLPHDGSQDTARAERRDVQSDVCRTAGALLGGTRAHDRDGNYPDARSHRARLVRMRSMTSSS